MKKIILSSILLTVMALSFSSCGHRHGHHGDKAKCACEGGKEGCKPGAPCGAEDKDKKEAECADCKK